MATFSEAFGLEDGVPEGPTVPSFGETFAVDQPRQPNVRPEAPPSLGGEFARGASRGTDALQMALFGVASMAGRELGIDSLREFGDEGVKFNQAQLETLPSPSVGSISEIEDAGDFFRWAAGGLGQATPSISLAVASGGLGGVIARQVAAGALRRAAVSSTTRRLTASGFSREAAQESVERILSTQAGKDLLIKNVTAGLTLQEARRQALTRGATSAAVAAGALPQIGQIDIDLQEAGVSGGKSAITALLGGTVGGALEALPALRFLDKAFPGVDRAVSKAFVKDLAAGMGTQSLLEGSTETAQEFIQLASLAFHDPTFDPFSEESRGRMVDAFAIGALAGGVLGAGGATIGEGTTRAREIEVPEIPEFKFGDRIQKEPDFEPADNTFFEELQGRVRRVASEVIDPAINRTRAAAVAGINAVVTDFGPGANGELRQLTDVLKDAHESFVTENSDLIDRVTEFTNQSVRRIYERATSMTNPETRQQFVEEQIAKIKEQAERVGAVLNRRAKQHEQNTTDTVDAQGITFADIESLSGEVTEARPTQFVFGKNNTGGRVKNIDLFKPTEGEVQGFATLEAAEKLLERLKSQFPSATESTFDIREQNDGSFVVELNDPANAELLIEDDRITRGLERARINRRRQEAAFREAKRAKKPQRAETIRKRNEEREIVLTRPDGKKTRVDFPTLIFAARDLTDVNTQEQAVATVLGRLFDRGLITSDQVQSISDRFTPKFKGKLPGPASDAEQDFDALTPRAKQEINSRINEQLDEENLTGKARNERRVELLQEELDAIDESAEAQRDLGVEEFGDEESFFEQMQGTGLETEAQQAAASASRRPISNPQERAQERARQEERNLKRTFNKRVNLKVFMPGASENVQQAVNSMTRFVQDKLGINTELRVINMAGIQAMVRAGHPHAELLSRTAFNHPNGGFTVEFDGGHYIMLDEKILAPELLSTVLAHELGHIIHNTEWNNLTDEGKLLLGQAFNEDTKGRTEPGRGGTGAVFSPDFVEFREWMADQLAIWALKDAEAKTETDKFFKAVGVKIQKLYRFLRSHLDRFRGFNQTYKEFIDDVARRARGELPQHGFFKNEVAPETFSLPPLDIEGDGITLAIPQTIDKGKLNEIVKRFESRYPTTAKRATLIRNWMFNAYSVVASPATSTMRRIGKRIPQANTLIDIFGRQEHGKPKAGSNYHQLVRLWQARFLRRYEAAIEGKDKAKIAAELMALDGKDGNVSAEAAAVRALFDEMYDFLVHTAGIPMGKIKNYYPRMYSRQKLIDNEKRIIRHLEDKAKMSNDKARAFFNSLISEEADSASALRELGDDTLSSQAPAFANMRSRTIKDPFFSEFLEENLDAVVANYVSAASKRGVFNILLGAPATTKEKWKARGRLQQLWKDARNNGATRQDLKVMRQFVDANLGMLGRDFEKLAPGARNVMAGMVAYQNMRVLLFTVFASLPDLAGPAIRSSDMKNTFKTTVKNIQELWKTDSDLHELARTWGVISDSFSNHIVTEYVDRHFMPPTLRKWNDAFFKYTGLENYTNFTRKVALAVGIDFIKNQANLVTEGKTEKARFRAEAALKELGINKSLVDRWVRNGERTWGGIGEADSRLEDQLIAEALVQFVDESIMRPNASQRPILASHPAAMLVFHLKGYMYALYEVVGRRLAHNFRIADTPAQVAAVAMPAVAMLALTAVGLELREIIQYGLSNRTPPTNRMDGWDYTWTLVERSGLLGPSQMAIDFEGADRLGMNGLAAVSGPTLSQFADVLSKPPSQTVPKALPIVGQIPWARDAMRETPLL